MQNLSLKTEIKSTVTAYDEVSSNAPYGDCSAKAAVRKYESYFKHASYIIAVE